MNKKIKDRRKTIIKEMKKYPKLYLSLNSLSLPFLKLFPPLKLNSPQAIAYFITFI